MHHSLCQTIVEHLTMCNLSRFKTALTDSSAEYGSFASSVLTHMPWCIDFYQRMLHFRSTVDSERRAIQGTVSVSLNDCLTSPGLSDATLPQGAMLTPHTALGAPRLGSVRTFCWRTG